MVKKDKVTDTTQENTALGEEKEVQCCGRGEDCNCDCGRRTERSEKDKKDLLNRLSRIEGQIRGIRGMVENDAYCPDILTQVSAASCALNSFNKQLLGLHIRGCVAEQIRFGNEESIDELVTVLQKLMK